MKNSYKVSVVLLMALTIFAMPGLLHSQSSENLTMLGNWGQGGGEIRAVSNFGDLVYYGVGNVLKIVSFEDPASPYSAGSVTLDDMVEDIVWTNISGQTYCIVSGTSLNIVNVTNPMSPTLVSTLALAGYGEGLAISGTNAYVAVGGSGMEVVDFSDPANPASIAVAAGAGSGYAEGINVTAPYAYLGNGANLSIFDITTPASPLLVGNFADPAEDWIQDAMAISNYVYVLAWGTGVHVVDVSVPAAPTLVTTLSNPTNADIMFDGNYGYIASRGDGLTVIDVSTPSAPTLVGTFATDGTLRKVSFGAIDIGGTMTGHIFTAEVSAVGAVNVSDAATSMAYSGKVNVLAPADGICYSVLASGTTAYTAYGDAGVRLLDVANPAGMSELSSFDTPGSARKIVLKDDVAYIADRAGGVLVYDVSNSAAPDSLTAFVPGTSANDIALSGNYVYAAMRDTGIAIINATTANAPVLVSYMADFYGEGCAADGNVLGQSTWDDVILFDITDPAAPVYKSTIELSTGTGEFALAGDFAYIHDYDTLRIYDISDLVNPTLVGQAFTAGSWDGSASIEGNYAYVNSETNGIHVFDITDKANPVEVASYDGTATVRNVFAVGGYIYSAEKEGGLSVYRNELVLATGFENHLPAEFSLNQNFPNPFNPSTMIEYNLSADNNVTLEVFNLLGAHVTTLVSGRQPSGIHKAIWNGTEANGSAAPSGVYIYRLTVAGDIQSRKMILMK